MKYEQQNTQENSKFIEFVTLKIPNSFLKFIVDKMHFFLMYVYPSRSLPLFCYASFVI